ncbi:serine protease inhibitor [Arthrobacter sp. UC242_113]|uniref:serine protease inhibitor n=1 Tax=Arthrobacter sp. UC242_113 TaxID=3374550 RepID=UPI0037581FF0
MSGAPPFPGAGPDVDLPRGADLELTVALTHSPGGPEHVFVLVSRSGELVESTLPDPAAAIAAVGRFGERIFFPEPGPPMLCTQQYGGPQVAVVTGTFNGRTVNSQFSMTDGCEIARWRALSPLLGGVPGSTGAI